MDGSWGTSAHWHVYQVLTKRNSLMRNYIRDRFKGGRFPTHIWLGVSVEDAAHTSRIEHLKQINSVARFISFEPLLGPIGDVDLQGIAWAIVGGESGPRARPIQAQAATTQHSPNAGLWALQPEPLMIPSGIHRRETSCQFLINSPITTPA